MVFHTVQLRKPRGHDRWLEEVNSGRLLPAGGAGKYEVSKALVAPSIELATAIPAAIPARIAA